MAQHEDIQPILGELLAQVTGYAGKLRPETDLLDELALDSAQVMEFVMEVEDRFEIVIEQERLAEVRTIGQLADIVRSALK